MKIEIELVFEPSDEVRMLVTELEDELAQNYPPEQRHGLSLDAIFQSHIRFFLARTDGTPVGCGGVAILEGHGEVKRMYVRPIARGTGIAEAIIARLERETIEAGQRILRLETGIVQDAAIRFYQRCGFRPCEAFEPYASMPKESIKSSLFFEKML